MEKHAKWRRLFPNWRFWVEPPAIVTVVGGVFWAWIGVSGIADGAVAWQFFLFGVGLSLLAWWTIAYSGSKADRQAEALRDEARQAIIAAEQHHADSEQRYEMQLAEQQRHHDLQMAELKEANNVLKGIYLQLKEPDVPPEKVAALNISASLAEAVMAEDSYTAWVTPTHHKAWFVPQPFIADEELPAPLHELQAALQNLSENPPTDASTALAAAKQISALSQAIPNKTTSQTIAEQVASTTMQSSSSGGAHRQPKSSS